MDSRTLFTIGLLAGGALGLAACGGGGHGGGAVAATVHGQVVANNGSSANVGGVALKLVGGGGTLSTSTDAGGRFDFGTIGHGTWDVEGETDDVGEPVEVEGNEVELRLEVEDGSIVKIEESSEHGLEAEIDLTRAASSDDPDVEGSAKIEVRDGQGQFEIEAEHLDPGRSVEAFLIQGGVDTSLGTRTADAEGEAKWQFDQGNLPLNVTKVEDLEGLRVEVRDANSGLLLLFGDVPNLPVALGEQELEAKALLTPAASVAGSATVELEQQTEEGQTEGEIEFEAEDLTLADGTVLVVRLEDPNNLGTLADVGTMTVDSEGEAELKFKTEDGGTLPFGVTSLSALVGMSIEIRVQATNALLFTGTVPSL